MYTCTVTLCSTSSSSYYIHIYTVQSPLVSLPCILVQCTLYSTSCSSSIYTYIQYSLLLFPYHVYMYTAQNLLFLSNVCMYSVHCTVHLVPLLYTHIHCTVLLFPYHVYMYTAQNLLFLSNVYMYCSVHCTVHLVPLLYTLIYCTVLYYRVFLLKWQFLFVCKVGN